jgi:hypothetical protein
MRPARAFATEADLCAAFLAGGGKEPAIRATRNGRLGHLPFPRDGTGIQAARQRRGHRPCIRSPRLLDRTAAFPAPADPGIANRRALVSGPPHGSNPADFGPAARDRTSHGRISSD